MKQPMTVFVFMSLDYDKTQPEWWKKPTVWRPDPWGCKVEENADRVFLGEQTFMADVPDDFNPIPGQVAALEEKKREALKLYQATIAEINERLSKLLAITNEVPA